MLILYHGSYPQRVAWTLLMYTMGSVGIARVAIEKDRAYSFGYAGILGIVAFLAMLRFVDSPIFAVFILALIGYLADRIVYDCTLIDDSVDSSDQGLIDSGRMFVRQQLDARNESETGLSIDSQSQPPTAGKLRPAHQPGRTVLFLALAALPLFGLGQFFLRDDQNTWNSALLRLGIYLFSSLSLLVTTSFLGLRRYLRQRHADMPADVSVAWLAGGVGMIGIILMAAFLAPMPGQLLASLDFPDLLDSPSGNQSSRYGWGDEAAENAAEDSATTENDPFAEQKETKQLRSQEGAPQGNVSDGNREDGPTGNQSGGNQSGSGEDSSSSDSQANSSDSASQADSSGSDSSENQSSSGQDSSNDSSANDSSANESSSSNPSEQNAGSQDSGNQQNQSDQAGNDSSAEGRQQDQANSQQASENQPPPENAAQENSPQPNDQVQQAESETTSADDASGESSSGESSSGMSQVIAQTLSALGGLLRMILIAVLVVIVATYLWIHRETIAQWWRRLWEREPQVSADPMLDEFLDLETRVPPRSFSSFQNPIGNESDPRKIVVITFMAFEAWIREQGSARQIDETPSEFVRRVARSFPKVYSTSNQLVDAYNRIVYGRGKATSGDVSAAEKLWHTMRAS